MSLMAKWTHHCVVLERMLNTAASIIEAAVQLKCFFFCRLVSFVLHCWSMWELVPRPLDWYLAWVWQTTRRAWPIFFQRFCELQVSARMWSIQTSDFCQAFRRFNNHCFGELDESNGYSYRFVLTDINKSSIERGFANLGQANKKEESCWIDWGCVFFSSQKIFH